MGCDKIVEEVRKLQDLAKDNNDILGPLKKLEARYQDRYMTCGQVDARNFSDALYDIEEDEIKLEKLLMFIGRNKNASYINELLNTKRAGKSRRRRRRSTRKHVRKTRRNRRKSRKHRK